MARPKTDFIDIKCCICGKGNLTSKTAIRGEYIREDLRRKWACTNCYNEDRQKNNPNSQYNLMKSVRNCRTGNQNPNHETTKARKSQKLACRLYGWIDLNEENDNYNFPIDCYDPKTGLYHQVQGRYYSRISQWTFGNFKNELEKIYENMVCFCFSKDGKIVERIYKFLRKEIMRVKGITIYKNPSKGGQQNEQYRVTDEDELKNANDIWKEIINEPN